MVGVLDLRSQTVRRAPVVANRHFVGAARPLCRVLRDEAPEAGAGGTWHALRVRDHSIERVLRRVFGWGGSASSKQSSQACTSDPSPCSRARRSHIRVPDKSDAAEANAILGARVTDLETQLRAEQAGHVDTHTSTIELSRSFLSQEQSTKRETAVANLTSRCNYANL